MDCCEFRTSSIYGGMLTHCTNGTQPSGYWRVDSGNCFAGVHGAYSFCLCIVSDCMDGRNLVKSGATVDASPRFRSAGGAGPHRLKRDFQTQSASISATSKGVGQFGAVEETANFERYGLQLGRLALVSYQALVPVSNPKNFDNNLYG